MFRLEMLIIYLIGFRRDDLLKGAPKVKDQTSPLAGKCNVANAQKY